MSRGQNTWEPVAQIVDALDQAFYTTFQNVEPTGKRWLLALDVSGSMSIGAVAGVPGSRRAIASAAMALVTAATEPSYSRLRLLDDVRAQLGITPPAAAGRRLKRVSGLPFAGTDCALPMVHAREQKLPVDVFVVYTDSETWYGKIHPVQALARYRQAMGIPARLIVVGMVANQFSIADPDDAGMLDVVGFDTATPAIMADFAQGVRASALAPRATAAWPSSQNGGHVSRGVTMRWWQSRSRRRSIGARG